MGVESTGCIHEGIRLPTVSKDYYKMAMMLVTVGNGDLKSVDVALQNTRNTMISHQPLHICQSIFFFVTRS